MTLALLTLNLLSVILLAVVAVFGILIPQGEGALGKHLSLALITTLIAVFTHIMTYFYFVGIGSSLRRALEETGQGREALRASRRIKARVLPWAGGAVLIVMITFILGGGAHTRALPGWVHGALGYFALGFSALALVFEARLLVAQNRVVNELESQLVGTAEPAPAGASPRPS